MGICEGNVCVPVVDGLFVSVKTMCFGDLHTSLTSHLLFTFQVVNRLRVRAAGT